MSIAKIWLAVRNDFDASLFKVIIAAVCAYLALAVTLIFKTMDNPYKDLLTIMVGGFVISVIAVIHWVVGCLHRQQEADDLLARQGKDSRGK